jgi:hypothetical protein
LSIAVHVALASPATQSCSHSDRSFARARYETRRGPDPAWPLRFENLVTYERG